MAQIWIAFGQSAGAIRVSQEAVLELRRWCFDAVTPRVTDEEWETQAIQVLDRFRAIGSLAAFARDGQPRLNHQWGPTSS